MEGLQSARAERRKHIADRALLVDVIRDQYANAGLALPHTVAWLTSPESFTVTTAHQPSLLTGPLYHIYKIASAIQLAGRIRREIPDAKIAPVFVVGGEDHDWAEINHLYLYGKRFTWSRDANGPCGRLNLDGLESVIDEVMGQVDRNPFARETRDLLFTCMKGVSTYGAFHQKLLASLFSRFGLIVLNMDDRRLKMSFAPWMARELIEGFSAQHVPPVQRELETLGFRPQAFCRPVNLFSMAPGRRERIERDGENFLLADTGRQITRDALLDLLDRHPENFSPNVILRPLYQEFILPNIAYVGGGGEIAYWLERRAQFDAAGIPFPALIRRNSLLLMDEATNTQLKQMGLSPLDVLDDYDLIVRQYLKTHSPADLTFDRETAGLQSAFAALAEKAEFVDHTLAQAIRAEQIKQVRSFEQLGARLLRAEKQHQEVQLKRIQKIRERLFPENGLQERRENFLPFYTQYGPEWLAQLVDICDPLDTRFTIAELPL